MRNANLFKLIAGTLLVVLCLALGALIQQASGANPTPSDEWQWLKLKTEVVVPPVTPTPVVKQPAPVVPKVLRPDRLQKLMDEAPAPMAGVGAGLRALNPQPHEVLLDPGCGFDARWLITACRLYGTQKAIGVEIDPEAAESARRYVAQAGYADRIKIITGDSLKLNIQADIAIAYMWPEFLEKFRPQIEKLDRFVSYGFDVPGLKTQPHELTGAGETHLYVWQKPPAFVQVPITRTVNAGIQRLPRGSYCEVCRGYCSNPMLHIKQQQIVGYKTIPAQSQPAARSGHWEDRKQCTTDWRGRKTCQTVKVWVPE
jgi:hypothetical protein